MSMNHDSLYVGDVVLYYGHGDVNTTPVPAIIQDVTAPGVYHLGLMPKNSQTITPKPHVHHVDCQLYREKSDIAITYGGWDYIQVGRSRREESDESRRQTARRMERSARELQEDSEQKFAEDKERVHKMRDDDNMTAVEIAEKMGQHWSYQRVNALLRKHNKLVAT